MSKRFNHKILNKFVFNFLLISTITAVFFGILRIINLDPDTFLLKQFFAIRGDREVPNNIIIVSADATSFTKLNLSFKRPFDQTVLLENLQKILSTSPEKVFVDARFFNNTGSLEEREKLLALRSLELVEVYQESLLTEETREFIPNEYAESLLSWNLKSGLVSSFPSDVDKLVPAQLKLEQPERSRKDLLINFYGKPSSVDKVYLHELSEKAEVLKGKIVIFGIENIIKEPGHTLTTHLSTVASNSNMFSTEILASSIANLLDKSAIKSLPLKSSIFSLFLVNIICSLIISITSFKIAALVLAGLAFGLALLLYQLLFSFLIFINFSSLLIVLSLIAGLYSVFRMAFSRDKDISGLKKMHYMD